MRMMTPYSQPGTQLISIHTSPETDKTISINSNAVKSRLPDDLDPETDELAWKEWLLFEAWRVGIVE